jgi:AcrR family transcriptional regulator
MDKEQEILQYIQKRIFREGFYKTSMDDFAEGLQISKKTFYKYFDSKKLMIEKATFTVIELRGEELYSIAVGEKRSMEKMYAIMALLTSFLSMISPRYLEDVQTHFPELWVKINAFRAEKINRTLSLILKQAKKENAVRDIPEELMIRFFISAINGVVNPDFILKSRL